jgi:hypothetical protein
MVTPLTSYNMVADDGLVTARPDFILDDSAVPLPPAFPCPPIEAFQKTAQQPPIGYSQQLRRHSSSIYDYLQET